METLANLFKKKYRVLKIENIYFVQKKHGIMPWKNKYISTDRDRAMYSYKILVGTRKVITESV